MLWESSLEFSLNFEDKGYKEEAEHRDQARALSIKIGMAVAMADGSLDDSEGDFLKEWITKTISPFSDEKREELKKLYNKSMVEAYKAAENDNLTLSELTESLNEIAEKSTRYETIELCYDVMAADGVIDPNEIQIIRNIAEALELDFDEIEKIRDVGPFSQALQPFRPEFSVKHISQPLPCGVYSFHQSMFPRLHEFKISNLLLDNKYPKIIYNLLIVRVIIYQ